MYCRHSKKEVLVELSSSSEESLVLANKADNMEIRRSGKNLSEDDGANGTLDLKAHWDQMSKEEIEEELRIHQEAWERKRGRSEFPDQVMVPYMPRIPGRAVEKWRKEIQSEIEEDDYSSVQEEMEEEEPAHLAIDVDDQDDQGQTRLYTGTDKPGSWTEKLKSCLPSFTTDSGFSELDTASQSSSSSETAKESENGRAKWKTSFYGVVGLVVILGFLALFGGLPPDSGSFFRLSRASKATPLHQRLHETTVLGHVIGAVDLQNSIINSNVSVPSLIEEATDIHNILPYPGDSFKLVKDLVERFKTNAVTGKTFNTGGLVKFVDDLTAWTPLNISMDPKREQSLESLRNVDLNMTENVNKWLDTFRDLETKKTKYLVEYVDVFKKAYESLENYLKSFPPMIEALCMDLTPIKELDGLKEQHLKKIAEIKALVNPNSQVLKIYVPMLDEFFQNDDVRVAVQILNGLTPSVRRSPPPKALFAFPRGIEDLNKVPEDLKDPWLMKVLNENRDLDKLAKSLKYILHLTGNMNYASQLFHRFKAKNSPESLVPDEKHLKYLRELGNLNLNYMKPMASVWKSEKIFELLQGQDDTELAKLSVSADVLKLETDRNDICEALSLSSKNLALKIKEDIINTNYTEIMFKYNRNETIHNGIVNQFKELVDTLTTWYPQIEAKTPDLSASISKIAEEAAPLEEKLINSTNWNRETWEASRNTFEDLQKIVYFLSEPTPKRMKREANEYADLRNSFQQLRDVEDAIQNITTKPLEYGFDELLNLNISETAGLSRELGYSQRFMETLVHLDAAIATIEGEGPKAGWTNSGEAVTALKKIKHKEDFGPVEESQNLTEHAKVYKVLDKIGETIPNMTLDTWRKEVESLPNPDSKLTEALYQLDGLEYAKMRGEMDMEEALGKVEEFFDGFFEKPVPEKAEETYLDLSVPLFFMGILTLLHILPAVYFYRYELYLKAYRANLSGPAYEPPKPPEPVKEPHVACPLPIRQVNKKGVILRVQAKGDPVEPPVKKEEATKKELIWDTLPSGEPEDDENMKPEEESNLLWVPIGDQWAEKDPISYGSDDLRSIGIDTLSTQSDKSDMMDITRSDYTIPVCSDSENEDILDRREYAEFPKEAEMTLEEVWEKYKYPWALKNRLTLQGYRTMTQMHVKDVKAWGLMEAAENDKDKKKEELEKEKDVQARIQWDQMLERDMDEVLRRRVNQEEVCRIQMKKQNLEQKLVDLEKASRDPLCNAERYIRDSYIPEPEEEINITRIAFESVNKIDNFIQSTYQDRYDHIYRCRSDMYTHDWARVKMSKDEPEDCDFYDACYVYPWPEVFEKVAKYIQTSEVWFPLRQGDVLRVRRNRIREYLIECTDAKQKFDACGVQRTFKITLILHGRRTETKKLKLLHMIDWDQDGLPKDWQHYVRVAERINRESMKVSAKGKKTEALSTKNQLFPSFDRKILIQPYTKLILIDRGFSTLQFHVFISLAFAKSSPSDNPKFRFCQFLKLPTTRPIFHFQRPVAVMSKHGNGRAMTLIISLMAAILARLDDDVSIHSMAQGARASKRHAITCCNQVYFWRMVHYELLFRVSFELYFWLRVTSQLRHLWFKSLRNQRVQMDERFAAYQDIVLAHKTEFLRIECRMWWYHFECELARYKRMEHMVEYLRKINEGFQYERREERRGAQTLYDAMDKAPEDDQRPPYLSVEPIRRKPLREGDKPRQKGRQDPVLDRDELTEQEKVYAEFEIDPLVGGRKLDGCYHWVKPSEQKEKFVKGVPVPENWKYWYTKEEQTGVVVPNPFF
ncbi:hypothetical protein CAEBREN_11659 [Caenorhabditis brenneri]|uniref:Protein-tyrosine phosphatase catalytic domain-containing protein n=1 Tax=Caenorhabditis brenneri TaxID=135651 RepID=G0MVT7_CAEBE|nr:hypothetical protein CAEBREN_11659 [Caenorhabditis brenneri]